MATLREYFDRDFPETLGSAMDWTVSVNARAWMGPGPAPAAITVRASVQTNESAFARFVTYFVPAEVAGAIWALHWLVMNPQQVLQKADESVCQEPPKNVGGSPAKNVGLWAGLDRRDGGRVRLSARRRRVV